MSKKNKPSSDPSASIGNPHELSEITPLLCGSHFRWISNIQLSRLFHIPTTTLATWRSAGKLPFHKVGRDVYYSQLDIKAFCHLFLSYQRKEARHEL